MLYLFSFLWNVILVLIFNMVIFYMRRLAIEMHCTRTHKFFIGQHPGNNCVLYIELFTNGHVSAIKKNNHSQYFYSNCCNFIMRSENWRLFYSLPTFCTKYLEVGPLAETYFFLLKTAQIWVITIVVVLDQSTVIFQKKGGGGITICVVLVISSKSWQCYVLSVGF